jgi:hypothetical protein
MFAPVLLKLEMIAGYLPIQFLFSIPGTGSNRYRRFVGSDDI